MMARNPSNDEMEMKDNAEGEMIQEGFNKLRHTERNGLFSSMEYLFEHCKGTVFVSYSPKIGYAIEFEVEIEDPRTHEGIPESRALEKRLARLIPEAGDEIDAILDEADSDLADLNAAPGDGIGNSGARFVLKVSPLVSMHSINPWENLGSVYKRFDAALKRLGYDIKRTHSTGD